MTVDDIRVYGDPVLRKKAARVEVFDEKFKAWVEEMYPLMLEADGIGLAAPQVNISKAFLVIGMPRENQDPEKLVFANPEILETRGEGPFEEGCLSLPGIREEVVRPEWIRLRYQDVEGQVQELEADGLLARVLQHEIDHLEGILLIDRISPARRSLLRNELKQLAEKSRERLEKERASQTAA